MLLIDKIKKLKGFESTEVALDINEPPEYQCKNIDYIIKDVDNIEKSITRGLGFDDYDSVYMYLEEADYSISSLSSDIEDLREVIESVRAWGNEWKDLAKNLINSLPEELVLQQLNIELEDITK